MKKYIYTLALFIGPASPFLKGQTTATNKEVIAIKADYYPNYNYFNDDSVYPGVATGRLIEITGSTTSGWGNLPEGKTYPDNSLILTEVTTVDGVTTPMEGERHRFKAMPANIETPPKDTSHNNPYLKAFVKGYGKLPSNPYNTTDLKFQETYAWFITSGKNGLDLSTGIANIPKVPTVSYGAVVVDKLRINDGKPDFIITQIAAPQKNSADIFELQDKDGKLVGNSVQVNFFRVTSLGGREMEFYYPDNSRFDGSGYRDLRIVAFDLVDFGINQSNYKDVAQLVYRPSGNSDPAFLAADEYSMLVYRNDCKGESLIGGTPEASKVGISTLQRGSENWLSEESGAFLELESSEKGFVITSNNNPKGNITHPEEGMIVWDTAEKCLKIYNDISGKPQWHCIDKCTKESTPTP